VSGGGIYAGGRQMSGNAAEAGQVNRPRWDQVDQVDNGARRQNSTRCRMNGAT